jgi:hypothetical protein
MDFADAIEFSKKFPMSHPKVFIGFAEWGICDSETDGYVVLTDASSAMESSFNELEDYVKSHKLRIDHGKDYLMICTEI